MHESYHTKLTLWGQVLRRLLNIFGSASTMISLLIWIMDDFSCATIAAVTRTRCIIKSWAVSSSCYRQLLKWFPGSKFGQVKRPFSSHVQGVNDHPPRLTSGYDHCRRRDRDGRFGIRVLSQHTDNAGWVSFHSPPQMLFEQASF